RDDYATCAPPARAELLRTAGRDHVQNLAALPGLMRDAARGFARVRRRSREHGEQPDMAKMFKTPPTFLNHVVSPVRTFATASLALADVKDTAK
ncbi:wax ester/triacylglycerol synthase domain-containing protein, partial [Mycobacterium kansasii]